METKKSKIVSIGQPAASKIPGTNYSFIKLENGDSGAVFFKTPEFEKKAGEEIEYNLIEKDGRKSIRLASKNNFQGKGYQRTNNKVEALKMAVEAFCAGRIDEKRIKPMAKFLESILSE